MIVTGNGKSMVKAVRTKVLQRQTADNFSTESETDEEIDGNDYENEDDTQDEEDIGVRVSLHRLTCLARTLQ